MLTFTEFFRRKPIFFRGKPTFFMEVFRGECNFSQSSVVRRKGKSSNGEWGRRIFNATAHSGTFANRKYEELSYPKNQKMCDPILVTLLKISPHYCQSSPENATPSSGTSPLVSYKEVLPSSAPHPRPNRD